MVSRLSDYQSSERGPHRLMMHDSRLWARIVHPRTMQFVHGSLTLIWIAMIPVAWVAGWLDEVAFVSLVTMLALISGHWSGWVAARAEAAAAADSNVDDAIDRLNHIEQEIQAPGRDDA
jgi:hypothetical protein